MPQSLAFLPWPVAMRFTIYICISCFLYTCIFSLFFGHLWACLPKPLWNVTKSSGCLVSAVYLFMANHSYRESWPECRGEVAEGGDRKEGSRSQGTGGLCLDYAFSLPWKTMTSHLAPWLQSMLIPLLKLIFSKNSNWLLIWWGLKTLK